MGASGSQAGLPRPELSGGLPTPGNPCQMQGLDPVQGHHVPWTHLGIVAHGAFRTTGTGRSGPQTATGTGRGGTAEHRQQQLTPVCL